MLQCTKTLQNPGFFAIFVVFLQQKTVDLGPEIPYNFHMEMQKQARKRRQDTRHAVYVVTNTVTGEQYVGITVVGQRVAKALRVRMQKHVRRALTEGKSWALCASIREHGAQAHTYGVLEFVRGRKPAHARERELIRAHQPALNSH